MKVIVNRCFGSQGWSEKAVRRMAELGYTTAKAVIENLDDFKRRGHLYLIDEYQLDTIPEPWRTDAIPVQVLEELGSSEASGTSAHMEVVEIPNGINWGIHDYDGQETVEEAHRRW